MQKPKAKKIAGELTEADLAKVIGGVVAYPVNKRRRPILVCCCCDTVKA